MIKRTGPFLYVVGDESPVVWRSRRARVPAPPIWATVALQFAVATIAAYAVGLAVTPEMGTAVAALALLTGAVTTASTWWGPRLFPRQGNTWRRLAWFAGATVVVALTLAILGDVNMWDIGPLDAVALALVSLLGATLTGEGLKRAFTEPRRVLVVGTGQVALRLVSSLGRSRAAEVVGVVDDDRLPQQDIGGEHMSLGGIQNLPELVRDHGVDLVLFAFVGSNDEDLVDAMAGCRSAGVEVAVVSRLFEGLEGRPRFRRLEGYPVISVGPQRGERASNALARASDVAISLTVIVLTAPLWLALGAAIKLDSRGPVFYRVTRVGRGGETFKMLKFRKMRDGARGPALTLANDERFTRMGRFLSRSKMDELPQLLNVVKGDMSLVGPRPEDEKFVVEFPNEYARVLSVRPGICGLSQICFRKEFEHLVGADFETHYVNSLLPLKLTVDRYYVDHRSWAGDLRVLYWTTVALLRGGELDIDHLGSHVAFRSANRSEGPVR